MEKHAFFELIKSQALGVTFDDVLLIPRYSEILPRDVELSTHFSRNIALNIPLVSAAMDTVTKSEVAITMARSGGIGIIHKAQSAKEQAKQVDKVKHDLNGIIHHPICASKNETMEFVITKRLEKGYKFHTIPVVNNQEERVLVGLLRKDELVYCDNLQQRVSEAMIPRKKIITAPVDTDVGEAYKIMKKNNINKLPLVDSRDRVIRLCTLFDAHRVLFNTSPMFNVDDKNRLRVGAAVGMRDDALERLELLYPKGIDVVVIDSSHGNSRDVIETIREIKKKYTSLDVVAGNVVNADGVKRLADAGADGIKVGIGPGSICTTRVIAGAGRAQISAVYNCAMEAQRYNLPICADGGFRNSGDLVKALAVHADSIMLGNMLAGTEEAPGEMIHSRGKYYKSYYGMGSLRALSKSKGARDRYNTDDIDVEHLIAQGVEGIVPYRGKLELVIHQYLGGVRVGMGLMGTRTIDELRTNAHFERVSEHGRLESHVHDIEITKEAPNYTT